MKKDEFTIKAKQFALETLEIVPDKIDIRDGYNFYSYTIHEKDNKHYFDIIVNPYFIKIDSHINENNNLKCTIWKSLFTKKEWKTIEDLDIKYQLCALSKLQEVIEKV